MGGAQDRRHRHSTPRQQRHTDPRGNQLDRQVLERFLADPAAMAEQAEAIRAAIDAPDAADPLPDVDLGVRRRGPHPPAPPDRQGARSKAPPADAITAAGRLATRDADDLQTTDRKSAELLADTLAHFAELPDWETVTLLDVAEHATPMSDDDRFAVHCTCRRA